MTSFQPLLLSTDPDRPFGAAQPLQSILSFTLNADETAQWSSDLRTAYFDAAVARLAGCEWNGLREGFPEAVDHPRLWSGPAWFAAMRAHPVITGKAMAVNPYVCNQNGKPGTAAGPLAEQAAADEASLYASHATLIRNAKWKVDQVLKAAPEATILLHQNELENRGIGSGRTGLNAAEVIVEDFPAGTLPGQRMSADGIQLMIKRNVLLMRAAREQIDGIDVPAGARSTPAPAYLFGPTSAFACLDIPASGPQVDSQAWSLRQLAGTWSGAFMRYLHGMSVHLHRVHSRIGSYANTPPSTVEPSLWWAWESQRLAMSDWPAVQRRHIPVAVTECGIYWDSAQGTWSGGEELIPSIVNSRYPAGSPPCTTHNHALRMHRMAMKLMALLWYGVIFDFHYALAHSGRTDQNMWDPRADAYWDPAAGGDGRRWRPLPGFRDWLDLYQADKYDVGANNFPRAFPVKAWPEFSRPQTWGVYLDQNAAPTGAPMVTPPWIGWENISFGTDGVPAGEVEMRGWTGAPAASWRNLIMRPVWLRHPSRTHRFEVKVNFPTENAAARAKIRVRGHNKLWGLENLEVEVAGNDLTAVGTNWKTIGIEFTHIGHGLGLLPDACYALLCCEHNAVGTVRFREPDLLVR